MDSIRIYQNEIENYMLLMQRKMGLSNDSCLMALNGVMATYERMALTEKAYLAAKAAEEAAKAAEEGKEEEKEDKEE